MNSRWRKAFADLRAYRTQIGLIALVLMLGTAGMVAALDARTVLQREIDASFSGANAPDLVLWFDQVDDAWLARVAAQPGVVAVAARRVSFVRITGSQGREFPLHLSIVRDPLAQAVARVHGHEARAAEADAGLWVERSGQGLLGAQPGAQLALRNSSGAAVSLPLAGWLHDPGVAPSTQEQMVYAWATPSVAAGLVPAGQPDQLLVKLARRGNWGEATEQGERLAAWAGSVGRAPLRVETGMAQHPHALLMTAMLRVLGVLSAIAFLSSAAWSAYMVSLWMRRELRVVGILKSLGARRAQIAAQYLALAGPLVLACALVAVPLGAALGQALVAYEVAELNIDLASTQVALPWRALAWALALLLPLGSVGWPIWRAARMTPQQAMSDAGVGVPGGTGRRRARWLRLPGDRRWTLALRNSFRRPWRLALMVAALASGGALVLTTHSNHEAVMAVVDASLANQGHDIELVLQRPAPAAVLEALARALPDVQVAEAWRRAGVSLVDAAPPSAEGADTRIALAGYPPHSALQRRPVIEGRLPRDDATDELLATRYLLAQHPAFRLDAPVRLRHGEREATVRVVGLVEAIGQATLIAPQATFEAVTGMGDAASSLRVQVREGVPLLPPARALDQALVDAQHTPAQVITRDRVRDALDEHVAVVGGVIRMIALAAALVGGLWLAASTALSVLERTREIGVLRSLGATRRDIGTMFLAEGAAVALLAALLSLTLAAALISLFGVAAGRMLLHATVPFHLSPKGLAIVAAGLLVGMAAVALAVQRVMRLSARDALAYE